MNFIYLKSHMSHVPRVYCKASILVGNARTGMSREVDQKAGAQPEIFQSRGGFVKLAHFDKHVIKKSRKKAPQEKNLEFIPLDTLKTTFWMAILT